MDLRNISSVLDMDIEKCLLEANAYRDSLKELDGALPSGKVV
jgi:hypothetical protein